MKKFMEPEVKIETIEVLDVITNDDNETGYGDNIDW